MEHFVQNNLDIEIPLNTINQVDLVKVSLLIEPSMSNVGVKNEWDGELPNFEMVCDEMKHCLEVLLRPEVPQLPESDFRGFGVRRFVS